jgi:integrase
MINIHILGNDRKRRQTSTRAAIFGPFLVVHLWSEQQMAGKVQSVNIESRTARSRLKRGRQPHWHSIMSGKIHLGWQCWKGDQAGRWVLRRYVGNNKYRSEGLGKADDAAEADGVNVLNFDQAEAKARAKVAARGSKITHLKVKQALAHYADYKRAQGQSVNDMVKRSIVHILPSLGDEEVEELTAEQLRGWLATMAATPAQIRPKAGQPQYKAAPVTDDDKRRRQATANRVLTMLKAALNHAYDEGHVGNRDAWGRKLKPFRNVEVARVRYLTIAEAQRLLNACDADFRPLVRAALETGCRYGELTRLEVADFNPDAGTVAIRKSKSGKPRHVVLTDEGAAFFHQHCAGRAGSELMLCHVDGSPWKRSEQALPMRSACGHARITPPVGFHQLRHTWASLAVMAGVPLMVVARNLGHSNTGMVEKHYGHLSESYVTEAIRAGAPRYGAEPTNGAAPLR